MALRRRATGARQPAPRWSTRRRARSASCAGAGGRGDRRRAGAFGRRRCGVAWALEPGAGGGPVDRLGRTDAVSGRDRRRLQRGRLSRPPTPCAHPSRASFGRACCACDRGAARSAEWGRGAMSDPLDLLRAANPVPVPRAFASATQRRMIDAILTHERTGRVSALLGRLSRRRLYLIAVTAVLAAGCTAGAVAVLHGESSAPLSGALPGPPGGRYSFSAIPSLGAGTVGWCIGEETQTPPPTLRALARKLSVGPRADSREGRGGAEAGASAPGASAPAQRLRPDHDPRRSALAHRGALPQFAVAARVRRGRGRRRGHRASAAKPRREAARSSSR